MDPALEKLSQAVREAPLEARYQPGGGGKDFTARRRKARCSTRAAIPASSPTSLEP
jgi:hypothetical protein